MTTTEDWRQAGEPPYVPPEPTPPPRALLPRGAAPPAVGHPVTWGSIAAAPVLPAALPAPRRRRRRPRASTVLGTCVGLLLTLLVAVSTGLVVQVRDLRAEQKADALQAAERIDALTKKGDAQNNATNGLSERLGKLEGKVDDQPDLARVAAAVEPSVFTIRTPGGVGSGFAFAKIGNKTGLVTNYHVVASEFERGRRNVSVLRELQDLNGVIEKVDPSADLALVTVDAALPLLTKASKQPAVGDPVLAVGSPLGLGGTASSGIVSAERDGRLQFSAPVSPGNSGGPVVDRTGKVLGVTTSKLVDQGVEGLAFAIPVSRVCATVVAC
jgi:S1-C subfamily serine protease